MRKWHEVVVSKVLSSPRLKIFILIVLLGSAGMAASISAAPLSEAELFFELNDTDGDLGIHSSIDGGPYIRLVIKAPSNIRILNVRAEFILFRQGLTQLFFESAEPSFDKLSPDEFFGRFPEGTYEITATTRKGKKLRKTVQLSHLMAAPVENVRVNGTKVAEDCDARNLPRVSAPVIIDWDPVTQSHPSIGKSGTVEIVRYQFFVEQEDLKFSADLIPNGVDVTKFRVPPEFFALGDITQPFKFEIIARTSTGNNTAIENCFVLKP